jgi:hypothetical protein
MIAMKSLKTYLMEAETTYQFRLKVACECNEETLDKLETALEKYELKSLSKPKRTPIQEHPTDFQTLNNAEVHIMDAEVQYPVTAYQLYEYISQVVGIPASHLVVINKDHPEEIAREEALKEEGDEYVTKLEDADYKDADKVKVEDHFGDKYNENMLKDLETRKYEFAKE